MSELASFRAIADDNRRIILDLLRREGPLRAGDLVAQLNHISQPAVSKHLRILREANLVRAEKVGREQIYHLMPAPLAQIASWLAHYEPLWEERLETLKELVETRAAVQEKDGNAATCSGELDESHNNS